MKRFCINKIFTANEIIDVPHNIVRHIHVVRLTVGETVELFNGQNQSYLAEIISLEKHHAALRIIRINPQESVPQTKINLAIALVANDKMDLIIQKAVELGVDKIIPLYSKYSARLPNTRSANRLTHWQNIIISSACQCGQNQLPTIDMPINLNSLYEKFQYDVKVIMNPQSDLEFNYLNINNQKISQAILLVGPEGGFSNEEAELAAKHNYRSLQLGNLIMRSETAVIAGLSILNLYLKQWHMPGL